VIAAGVAAGAKLPNPALNPQTANHGKKSHPIVHHSTDSSGREILTER